MPSRVLRFILVCFIWLCVPFLVQWLLYFHFGNWLGQITPRPFPNVTPEIKEPEIIDSIDVGEGVFEKEVFAWLIGRDFWTAILRYIITICVVVVLTIVGSIQVWVAQHAVAVIEEPAPAEPFVAERAPAPAQPPVALLDFFEDLHLNFEDHYL